MSGEGDFNFDFSSDFNIQGAIMAFLPSGQNFTTSSKEGVNFAICNTIDTVKNPELPALPFLLGDFVLGLDGSEWFYAEPAANYAIGTVGYLDTSWKFTAITTTNAAGVSGQKVGVMSQAASTTASPTSTNYDGVWVQVSGGCPAIQAAASTTANAQLYTSATAGQLTSTSSGNVAVNGVILTTAVGSGGAATAVGILNNPEVLLTT
jgi:hypothetical protein